MTEDAFAKSSDDAALHVTNSAVKQLSAASAHLQNSAVQQLEAQTVDAGNSAFAVTHASTLELRNSAVGIAAGDYVKVEDSQTFLLLAPRVSGNVRAVLTLPTAFALGAGFFLARWAMQTLFRRSKD